MHREIHEANIYLSSDRHIFHIDIPEKALVAIPYSPTAGILDLSRCLIEGEPFSGMVYYKGKDLPDTSVAIAFLAQKSLDPYDQLKRINEAVNDGASLIFIAHMTEGMSPAFAKNLRTTVKQLCSDCDITVINEEYHEYDLRYYEWTFDLECNSAGCDRDFNQSKTVLSTEVMSGSGANED